VSFVRVKMTILKMIVKLLYRIVVVVFLTSLQIG
jgi:hypothetical protein